MTTNRAGRKPNPDAEAIDPGVNEAAVAAASQDANALALNLQQIAADYGDGQDYDRARVVHEARMFMSASAEAMLEAGKRLIVLRENEPHGDFLQIVEGQLGLNKRTAQVMMQASARYLSPALASKAQTSALLGLGKSKLIELMVEPDEALCQLVDGGTLAGLKLEDIDSMSVQELKRALRKERDKHRKDVDAKDKVIAGKESKVSELEEALARRQSADPSEAEAAQLDELRAAALEAETGVRRLLAAAARTAQEPASESTDLAARQNVAWVAQVFAQLISAAAIDVDFTELVTPAWLNPAADRKA
jgi:hypothetical protein